MGVNFAPSPLHCLCVQLHGVSPWVFSESVLMSQHPSCVVGTRTGPRVPALMLSAEIILFPMAIPACMSQAGVRFVCPGVALDTPVQLIIHHELKSLPESRLPRIEPPMLSVWPTVFEPRYSTWPVAVLKRILFACVPSLPIDPERCVSVTCPLYYLPHLQLLCLPRTLSVMTSHFLLGI